MEGPGLAPGRGRAALLVRLVRRLALAAAGAVLGLALLELGLRAAGAPLARRPTYKDWTRPSPWARYEPRPGRFHLWDTTFTINADGFRGPRAPEPEVLALGDSCVFGAGVSDAQVFTALLSRRPGDVLDAGVPGYTVFQGLARSREPDLAALRPGAVLIWFGWNDMRRALMTERMYARLLRWSRRSRVATALLPLDKTFFSTEPSWTRWNWVPRVPPGDFERDLVALAREARARGAVPILITGPCADKDRAIPGDCERHERYNERVREAARESGAVLVDFAKEVAALPHDERNALFLGNIHLSPLGHRRLAERLRPVVDAALARR